MMMLRDDQQARYNQPQQQQHNDENMMIPNQQQHLLTSSTLKSTIVTSTITTSHHPLKPQVQDATLITTTKPLTQIDTNTNKQLQQQTTITSQAERIAASKPKSKWTQDPSRIVLAPIETQQHDTSLLASPCAGETESIASTATAVHSTRPHKPRHTLDELLSLESTAKDAMTLAGKVCMDAWTAALEASRAYRVVRKEWRKAKRRVERKTGKVQQQEMQEVKLEDIPIQQDACEEENISVDAPVEADAAGDAIPCSLPSHSDFESLSSPLSDDIDEVEQMEQVVHDVESTEIQYAALTQVEEEQEEQAEEDAEVQQQQIQEALDAPLATIHEDSLLEGTSTGPFLTEANASSSSSSSAHPPKYDVLTFSFGGSSLSSRRPLRPLAAAKSGKLTASDKARQAALKLKLEQDMREHEARRLALAEAQRLKQIEYERRRQQAKEKNECIINKRMNITHLTEVEKKRQEAEARKMKLAEEEKRMKKVGKEKKRKELEQTIQEMKAAQQQQQQQTVEKNTKKQQ